MKNIIDSVEHEPCPHCGGVGEIVIIHSHSEPETEDEWADWKVQREKEER